MPDDEISVPILYRPFVRQILFVLLGIVFGGIVVEAMVRPLDRIDFFTIAFTTIIFVILMIDEALLWYWNRNEDLSAYLD